MTSLPALAVLFARLALGASMLSAVADRFGLWGRQGDPNVVWGNWASFVEYTSLLNFEAPAAIANVLAIIATAAECMLSLALIVGFRTKWAALGAGVLLLIFALAMSFNASLKSALDYSVYPAAAAGFLLAIQNHFRWSVDELF